MYSLDVFLIWIWPDAGVSRRHRPIERARAIGRTFRLRNLAPAARRRRHRREEPAVGVEPRLHAADAGHHGFVVQARHPLGHVGQALRHIFHAVLIRHIDHSLFAGLRFLPAFSVV